MVGGGEGGWGGSKLRKSQKVGIWTNIGVPMK